MPSDRTGAAGVKILLLAEVFPPRSGGSGRWLWELYRRLEDVSVHVVAGTVPDADTFDRAATVPIERIPLSFSSWGVWTLRGSRQYGRATIALNKIVARVRPDVIHCGKCLPEALIASLVARWHGIPFCCYVHGEELTLAGTSRELTRLTRNVLRAAAVVIANSRHSRDILVQKWGLLQNKVTVMHPGVDTSQFTQAPPNPEVRQRLGWSNRRVILTVGALQKRKGQDMMIRALPAIRARCPDVLYAMVGEGWERAYLETLVAEHQVGDLVQFRGAPSDAELIECYQQCDLFVLANRQVGWDFEGFGIVLLEAQSCGKPVIAGSSGGTWETIIPSVTGLLVSCETPEPIVDAVCGLLDDPERRAKTGARGRDWVVKRFDWNVLRLQAQTIFGSAVSTARALE